MKTSQIEYNVDGAKLIGYFATNEIIPGKKPLILIFHDWSGRNEFACKKAEKLAELGYSGFAVDMYGDGKVANTMEEKNELMQHLLHDRTLIQKRVLAALNHVKTLPDVDTSKIAAIGFCFGGLCALDLARTGADIKGVVSFHGALSAPKTTKKEMIKAKILALHGHDDPIVTMDAIVAFQQEMTEAQADWQMVIYGNAKHSFTNPQANDPGNGLVYNALADKRSWLAMRNFFDEIFNAVN